MLNIHMSVSLVTWCWISGIVVGKYHGKRSEMLGIMPQTIKLVNLNK